MAGTLCGDARSWPRCPENYAPSVAGAAFNARRNAYVGSAVGAVGVTDLNAGDKHTFAITGGTGAGLFSVDATQIASVNGYTSPGVYTPQASQTSAAFTLTAGRSYSVEALQKQGEGGDFLQVAWTGPGITTPTILPGSVLQPYNINAAPTPAWPSAPPPNESSICG